MPASQGTPTIWEKIQALFEQGSKDPTVQATLAGDKHDITKVLSIFQPILQTAETTGLGDLTTMLQGVLTAIPSINSIGQANRVVGAILDAEAGTMKQQAVSLGQTSMTTLVSAALAATGKLDLPLTAPAVPPSAVPPNPTPTPAASTPSQPNASAAS